MANERFFKCNRCGTIVGVVEGTGERLVCCGEKMSPLVANSVDAAKEKHVPCVTVKGGEVIVKVGSVEHPMTAEHHIAWIYLQSEKGGQRRILPHDGKPEAVFALTEGDRPVAVFAYCNLHGLWVAEI